MYLSNKKKRSSNLHRLTKNKQPQCSNKSNIFQWLII
uniref:Uncharacterized protein n=1 Tax=Arundo donax TaxID=35708 RepID=A0A0A8YEV9_ARUDO